MVYKVLNIIFILLCVSSMFLVWFVEDISILKISAFMWVLSSLIMGTSEMKGVN